MVNLVFIHSETLYQIESKYDQIINTNNQDQIEQFISGTYSNGYEDYYRFNLIDVCLSEISNDHWALYEMQDYINEEKVFIAISERYRNSPFVESIFYKAQNMEDGYRILDEKDGIYIVIHLIE